MKSTTFGGIDTNNLIVYIKRTPRVSVALALLWLLVLWWGERSTFQNSVDRCLWSNWESWPSNAQPYHILLVADPQLVDPHTYPGRPWPLSSLTILYTDIYLQRSYEYLQNVINPDATLFLGDLFDGGREWATARSESPEERYKRFGNNFWMKEYRRFCNIFLNPWNMRTAISSRPEQRRFIASVPGNHDLGFASGIQPEVKARFEAFFGPLNRVDILGNHSIISLDTVSLSAMDQVDPATGSSGAGDGTAIATANSHIWKPVEDFLVDAKKIRNQAIRRECSSMNLCPKEAAQKARYSPDLSPISHVQQGTAKRNDGISVHSSQFPTILLSHVPLFRGEAINCGPHREHGSSIPLSAGYQYQNVLTPLISQDIITHLDAEEIAMIYSGDDHDYCEIEHSEFTGRIKEITVKSMSWAMGIRKPGVQLLSLWNPVDASKLISNTAPSTPRDTLQTQLCLLPDQLTIFIRYGQLLGLTLTILIIRAILFKPQPIPPNSDKIEPLLPMHKQEKSSPGSSSTSSQTSSTSAAQYAQNYNVPRGTRPRKHSNPNNSSIPPFANFKASLNEDEDIEQIDDFDQWDVTKSIQHSKKPYHRHRSRFEEFYYSVAQVAFPAAVFYFWLLLSG